MWTSIGTTYHYACGIHTKNLVLKSRWWTILATYLFYQIFLPRTAWSNYFRPTDHFTKTWQLAGHFHRNDAFKNRFTRSETKNRT